MRQHIPILSIDIDLLFWVAVGLGAGVLIFFGWLYYCDWRNQRAYRRHLESKRQRPANKEQQPR